MRNAEQPRLEWATGVEFVQLPISLEQSLLHNVFAVHDGASHAGTVAVQARTKLPDGLEKRQVTCFERARLMLVFRVAHNGFFRLRVSKDHTGSPRLATGYSTILPP